MINAKAIAGVILVFVLGAACGALITHTIHRNRFEAFLSGGPGAREEMLVKRLTHKLDLDQSQREQVRAIMHETHSAMRQVRNQYRPQVEQLLEQGQAKIAAVLRPEQKQKYQQLIAEWKKRRGPDR